MIKWPIFGLLIFLGGFEAATRRFHMTLSSYGWEFKIGAGNPAREIIVALNVDLSELILMDKKCGVRDDGCSHYCDDLIFSQIYCDPLCLPLTPQSQLIYCNSFADDGRRYEGPESNTSTRLNEKWLRQIRGTRRLVGEFWSDDLFFEQLSPGQLSNPQVYPMEAMRFVSAEMFDRRAVGVFGLKPGPNSAAAQLFDYHKIERRLLTVVHDSNSMLSLRWFNNAMTYQLGTLDGAHCTDWEFISTVSENDWTLRLDSFDLLGVRFDQKITIRLDFDALYFMIPEAVGEKLVASGRVNEHISGLRMYTYPQINDGRPCRPPGPLVFRHGKTEVRLSERMFDWSRSPVRCTTSIRSDPQSIDGDVIVMGVRTFVSQCVALDYDQHMVGFGLARNRASLIQHPNL